MQLETFRAFFEASPDALIVIDNTGKIVMASNRVKNLFDYETDELIGKEIEILIPAKFADKHRQHRKKYTDSPKAREMGTGVDLLALKKDGTTFYAEVSLSPIKTGNLLVLASIRDVSLRHELYNQLKVSSEEFRGAFEHSAIGMAIVSTEGKWMRVNKRVCDMLGYDEEEFLKTTFQDITYPEDLNLDLENVGKMLRGEIESYQMEKRYYHKNGSIIWVVLAVSLSRDAEGYPLHFVSQIKDITERKKAEDALLESEQRWQFALDGAGDGVWDWQVQNGTVYFSPRLKIMLGFDENDAQNEYAYWESKVHPDDAQKRTLLINQLLTGETDFYINELRLQRKNGEYLWVLARGKVVQRDEHNRALRVIGTHSDISWQKEKQQELQQSFNIISEQNKRLMNFAHIVSHNLRSHSGNFQLILNLLEKAENEEEKEQMVALLKDNAQALSDTIKHLNEVVQIQENTKIKREPLHLHAYVQKTLDILAGEITQHRATILNNVPRDMVIDYNPAYMESILLNFISNAIKYRHEDRLPEIRLETFFENERIILEIADNGKGINLEKHGQKLFGLYKTFHGNNDAKGVGLFIAKNQVEAMGGKIGVESRVNQGTTFRIHL